MVTLKPKILEKNGKKEFVILTYEEFSKLKEELEDYNDLKLLRDAKLKEKDLPLIDIEEVKIELGIKD